MFETGKWNQKVKPLEKRQEGKKNQKIIKWTFSPKQSRVRFWNINRLLGQQLPVCPQREPLKESGFSLARSSGHRSKGKWIHFSSCEAAAFLESFRGNRSPARVFGTLKQGVDNTMRPCLLIESPWSTPTWKMDMRRREIKWTEWILSKVS